MTLSVDDLPFLFEPRHAELGRELRGCAAAIRADAERGAAAVAAAMGAAHRLYDWLLPETGRPDVRALCLIRELLGYESPMADAIFAVQGLGTFPLAAAGGAAQRALLSEARAGRAVFGFALTEPEAGSDAASLRTSARRDGDGYVLDGEKWFISNAGIASHYTVFASLEPAAGRHGIAAFLVEAASPGLEVRPQAHGDHPLGALRLAVCRVPGDALIGAPGQGFALAMQTLDTFRVTVGAAAVGMARRAFDRALGHVRARHQFGKPLAAQQLVQAHLADMATAIDAARLLVLRAAWDKDHGREPATRQVSMAKLFATEAAQDVIDRAVQLLGGRGVLEGEVVEALYRAIRPLRIYEGTSEIQRVLIGRDLAREETR